MFASDACDPSGWGEGRELVDEFEFSSCLSVFRAPRVASPYARPWLTATARWIYAYSVGGGTIEVPPVSSDFSNCLEDVPEPGLVMQLGAGITVLGALVRRRRAARNGRRRTSSSLPSMPRA